MSGLRRALDYLHLAPYPEWRPFRSGCELGLNCHIGSERLEWMSRAGFTTAIFDYGTGVPVKQYSDLLEAAKAAGLKVFIVGLPQGNAYFEAKRLLKGWGEMIDYLSVHNEPDLDSQGYTGSVADFAFDVRTTRDAIDTFASHVQLVAPSLSSLGPGSCRDGWGDKRAVLAKLMDLKAGDATDYVGLHVYKRTPDAALDYLVELNQTLVQTGWMQPVYVSELGWRSGHILGRRAGEYRQALYLNNAVQRMSWLCYGVGVYVAQDDPPEDYGIFRAGNNPFPKRAAEALYRNRGL